MLAKFSGLNPKGPYLSLEKEKETFCVVLTYSIKRAREIRKFHVAVVQQRLRNVQKSVMHVQSCCFANINLLLFNCSRCRRSCFNSLLLWSRNFATMVTWRHTSPLYCSHYYYAHKHLLLSFVQHWGRGEGKKEKKSLKVAAFPTLDDECSFN